ncbi:MAG: hypothetical protein PHG48_03125 [Eubacteriales bacterium]|nr:hypothetical protein [Eubacteriales bacterium]
MIKLTKNEITYLASAFNNSSALSIFKNIKGNPDGTEYKKLTEKGVIKADGYSPEALSILTLLSEPERCSRLFLQNTFAIVEKYTYRKGDRLILAENNDGELVFSEPEDLFEVTTGLAEYVGASKIFRTMQSVSADYNEMAVFLAAVDICRKRNLMSLAGSHSASSSGFSAADITDELSSADPNGITVLFLKNYGLEAPSSDRIADLASGLVKDGYLAKSANGYRISDALQKISDNFLVTESVSFCELMTLSDKDELLFTGNLFVNAGLHDIISFYFDGDSAEMIPISAMLMLEKIEEYMSCPVLGSSSANHPPAPAPVPAPPPPQRAQHYSSPPPPVPSSPAPQKQTATSRVPADPGLWNCPSCGKQNKGNFCVECGTRKP